MPRKYKVLDLFAGAGGFSLGFKRFADDTGNNPFEIVGAVEKDEQAAKTLISALAREHNMPIEKAKKIVITGDITMRKTKKDLYNVCPKVDIIIGGPPCQSFSTIGPRSGDKQKQNRFANDDRDNLFEHYITILRHYKPLYFVFENVKGIISKKDSKGERYIDVITERFIDELWKLEYGNDIEDKYLILNAADYGVPQIRERVIIIGKRYKKLKSIFPPPTHCDPNKLDLFNRNLLPWVTLKDAIGDLPPVIPKITFTSNEKGKQIPEEEKKLIEEKNKSRFNGNDVILYPYERFTKFYAEGDIQRQKFLDFINPDKKTTVITGHVARSQQESDIKLFRGMPEGTSSKHLPYSEDPKVRALTSLIKYKMNSFEDKYKKLSWNRPCGTIFAHMTKDGNRFIHPDSNQERTLTVREAARIQSFPDDYVFEAVGNRRFTYIGNAVPPLLSRAIAKEIFEGLTLWNSEGGK